MVKWCHSIYLNDRQFVAYKLFSCVLVMLDYLLDWRYIIDSSG